MKKVDQSKLLDTLYKKAIGYNIEEVVEEYSGDEKGGELIKKKITKKPIPPDMTALKAYLDLLGEKREYEDMSEQELLEEKAKLLQNLK